MIMPKDYPCYGLTEEEQTATRYVLNTVIIRRYLMREIGYETYELWSIMLESRLREIMPYYQELYKTTLFELDLDNPYHMVTEHTEEGNDKRNIGRGGDSESTTSGSIDRDDTNEVDSQSNTTGSYHDHEHITGSMAHSDFPQASFSRGDYASYEEESKTDTDKEGSNTQKVTGSENATSTSKVGTNDSTKTQWGDSSNDVGENFMHYIHDVKGHTNNMDVLNAVEKWRDLIVNINQMIANDLADLFIMLYN